MAFKDTFDGLIDNITLLTKFNHKPHDPAKARKPLLDGIKRTQEQAKAKKPAPTGWWRVKNGVVALTVRINGDTFDINGVATNHMPEERFEEFLTKFAKAVNDGEFDEELKNHGNGDAKVHISKAPAKSGGTGADATLTGVRRSVGSRVSKGQALDEIEALLKSQGKYSAGDIETVIAEQRAAAKA